MFISEYLTHHKRAKFIIDTTKKRVPIIKILDFINKNRIGFVILKDKNKFRIFTDGDFRHAVVRDKNLINKYNDSIKKKKIITIDFYKTMNDAYKLFFSKNISCLPVIKHNNIISYLTLAETVEILSPERLNLDKKKLEKYELDADKHIIRYKYACLFVEKNMRVLDAACGTGYGSYMLSRKAKSVDGVDISKKSIIFAKHNYKSKNLKFLKMNILNINKLSAFNVIVSIETLEHLNQTDAVKWLKKCYVLLKKGGVLVCSSPLVRIRNGKPYVTNPHHLHEMRKNEFFGNLKKIFKSKFVNYNIQKGNCIVPFTNENEGQCLIALKK